MLPCSVVLVLCARLHMFPLQNQHFPIGRADSRRKRTVTTLLVRLFLHFPNENSTFCIPGKHLPGVPPGTALGAALGLLGASWTATNAFSPMVVADYMGLLLAFLRIRWSPLGWSSRTSRQFHVLIFVSPPWGRGPADAFQTIA